MLKNLKKLIALIPVTFVVYCLALAQPVHAHCQIPCYIYDDYMRIQSMLEDTATIKKSAHLIAELAGQSDTQSQNQLIRWVINKETHAQKNHLYNL